MTSPDRARAVAELDALTDRLVPATVALASVLDRVMAHTSTPPAGCVWCLEDAGWCVRTGGPQPCEAEAEYAAALVAAHNAPEVRIGGAS